MRASHLHPHVVANHEAGEHRTVDEDDGAEVALGRASTRVRFHSTDVIRQS